MEQDNSFNNGNNNANDFLENWNIDNFLPEFDKNQNIFSPFFQNELDQNYEEIHSYSNENNYPPNIQENKINIDNEILYGFNNENIKNISTKENSNENKETKNERVPKHSSSKEETKIGKIPKFQTKIDTLSYWRFDSAKKHWKTKISNTSTYFINKKIRTSDMPKEYKKKIHKPNSLLFSANVKESDNCVFLEKDLRTIFTIGKENSSNQKDNDYNISKIFEYFEEVGYNNLSDKMLEIKNFFEMKYEDLIKKFYESDEFINFKEEEKTIFFDRGTKEQEGFSISENLGLIRLFKRKRKRD